VALVVLMVQTTQPQRHGERGGCTEKKLRTHPLPRGGTDCFITGLRVVENCAMELEQAGGGQKLRLHAKAGGVFMLMTWENEKV